MFLPEKLVKPLFNRNISDHSWIFEEFENNLFEFLNEFRSTIILAEWGTPSRMLLSSDILRRFEFDLVISKSFDKVDFKILFKGMLISNWLNATKNWDLFTMLCRIWCLNKSFPLRNTWFDWKNSLEIVLNPNYLWFP